MNSMKVQILFSCFVLLSGMVFVTARKNDAAKNAFTKKFAEKMQINPDTTPILEVVKVPLEKNLRIFKMVYENYLKKGGDPNDKAMDLSKFDFKLLLKYLPKINTEMWAELLGKEIAKLMIRYGKLNQDNASKLASQAVSDFADQSKKFDAKNSLSGTWTAIQYGHEKFLSRYGLSYVKLAPEIAEDYAKEYACDFSGKCKS